MGHGKVYCERCDSIFDSKEAYERHLDGRHGPARESCPLDAAASFLARTFRKRE